MINRTNKTCMLLILILCLLAAAAAFAPESFASSEETQYDLAYNGQPLNEKGFFIKGTPYLPISLIGKYANNAGVSIDPAAGSLVIDLSGQNIQLADAAITSFVKSHAGTVYIPLKTIDGVLCFPLNVTGQLFKLQYTVSENAILLESFSGKGKTARINQDAVQAIPSLSEGISAPQLLSKGDTVSIISESDNYYKVELINNRICFVLKNAVTISEIDLAQLDFYAPKIKKYKQGSEKISLVWEYVDRITPPAPEYQTAGIDILAPTWFDLCVNGGGKIENNGDRGYTDIAHEKGYMVWATITNNMSSKGSTAYTSVIFRDKTQLNKSVAQYLFYACLYGVDGINIDYETVADSDADGLTAFTALLRQYTEKQGLVLSIDTSVPRPWNQEYDRDALAGYVDYIAVMAYDEHWSSSLVAGSVASLPWVEDAVIQSLSEIPPEKLLMGIPLYTRAWHFDSAGNLIKSTANTMSTIRTIMTEKALAPVWLSDEAQYYVSYSDSGLTKKIWIEDARSIAHKLDIVQRFNLAGAASWRLGQEEDEIWTVYDGMLKKNYSMNAYDQDY